MTGEPPMDADVATITDGELRGLLAEGREHADRRLVRLVTSYLTLRRVTAEVIAAIEAREGGATRARAAVPDVAFRWRAAGV